MDYSRARVKPGMCRDYPRAVLVQIAPTPSCPKIQTNSRSDPKWPVLALFAVGDVYASLCKRGTYAPFSARRRSQALF